MPAKKSVAKGDTLSCSVCGLVVVVDEACGCAEVHEVICCEEPMKKKPVRAAARRTKARPKAAKPRARARKKK